MKRFGKRLEDKADQIAGSLSRRRWDRSIPAMLGREIALTLDQIRRLRDRHTEQFRRLLRLECYIDTEIMQIQQNQPRYTADRPPEADKLRQRLFDIEKERRKLNMQLEEKTQTLEERLLSLINKHEQLDIGK